ncbi:MAG: precorrin-8X methylmutase [Geminicoccaceae bacterium]|nr:precorrin-8X methylmutase [Geminicoccaceae bacterium]
MTGLRYERNPEEIYRQSFAIIREEARLDGLPEAMRPIALRMMHACGMTDLTDGLVFSGDFVERARHALHRGAAVLCDAGMVEHGIIRNRLPAANPVHCFIRDGRLAEKARAIGNTRSAAAVEFWRPCLHGSVVVIGNAPTALFYLLERLDDGWPRPEAIIGLPVGFVGAAESKEALAGNARGCAFLTLEGRRGGSAMAAAALNALTDGPEASA